MSPSTDLQPLPPNLPGYLEEVADVGAWTQPPTARSAVMRFLAAILRYKWLVVGASLVGVGAGALAWRMVPQTYMAQGSLWINQYGNIETGPITQGGLFGTRGYLDLLRSYTVLDPVVVEQRLYFQHDPADASMFESFRIVQGNSFRPGPYELVVDGAGGAYTLRTKEGLVVETGTAGAPIGAQLGFEWTPPKSEFTPERVVAFQVLTPRDAAVRIRNAIGVSEQATFVQLNLRNGDPTRAATVLEAVMQRTVDMAGQLKRSRLDETNKILAEQLTLVEQDLKEAERELESFRVRTITLPTEDNAPIAPGLAQTRGAVMTEFFGLRIDLEEVRQNRERLEALMASPDPSGTRLAALQMNPEVQKSAELVGYIQELLEARTLLNSLTERYTDEYTLVRETRAKVQNLSEVAIPRAVETVLGALRTRESQLDAVIRARGTELEQIPPRMIEEARLERRVAIATQLYTELRNRFETSTLAQRSTAPDLQILDRPVVPTVPEADERIRFAGMAFAGILGMAVGLVFLLDRIDPRLRHPFDVTGEIGLPILCAVPHLKARLAESENQVREAFRELRVSVEYAHGPVRPLLLCVTSPAEQEGKSFVSANLAIAFAGLGRRTLLIDGDTRRGNAHELMRRQRKPGLTDYLLSGQESAAYIQLTDHENLWVMTSGTRRSGSPELLNSRAMQELLAAARKGFEVVILDSPPLSAGADAFVLAAHAGSLMVVVRSGSTNKALTMVKLEPLLRLPVRILGAVLNDYVPSKLYGGYRYYGDYIAGYEAHDETPDSVEGRTGRHTAVTS